MTERPYASLSIEQLESLYRTGKGDILHAIYYEVSTFRKTPRARRLLQEIEQELHLDRSKDLPPSGLQRDMVGHKLDNITDQISGRSSHKSASSCYKTIEFVPTQEQCAAQEAFLSGGSLKITAFAGAGKTSTLSLLAQSTNERGLYFAFNKAIVAEAVGKFPGNVHCATQHAYARRSFSGSYSPAKLTSKVSPKRLSADLDLKTSEVFAGVKLSGDQQAFLMLSTVRMYCQSADENIETHHVPEKGRILSLNDKQKKAVQNWIVGESRSLWERMKASRDPIPLGFSGYLKVWSLRQPKLPYDFVLLDEAQDTNPVVLSVLANQKAKLVYVGDAHQQIYEWRGAVNAMEMMQTDQTCYLTQSFRFGPTIAERASKILEGLGETQVLRGNALHKSTIVEVGSSRIVLTRTNSMVIAEVLNTIERGLSPHIVGGVDEIQQMIGDVFKLKKGEPANHPDFFGFTDWDEVVAFSQTDEGEELVRFVQLVERYGERRLWYAVKNTEPIEKEASICISTAHKAKGREWESVRIAEDFALKMDESSTIDPAEARLFYVSITRAKDRLVCSEDLLSGYCDLENYIRR